MRCAFGSTWGWGDWLKGGTPTLRKGGEALTSCGERMWVFCGWNQSFFLVGLMKQDLVYTTVVCFLCFLRKGMKGNQGGLLILDFFSRDRLVDWILF